jgi:hypothetical protein
MYEERKPCSRVIFAIVSTMGRRMT